MAAAVAKTMGLLVDWSSEAGRAGLLECLKAYRTAARELVQRDAGDVVDTPPEQQRPQPEPVPAAPANPGKCMADALEAWKGLGVRKAKTIGVFTRHVALFAEMMGDPELSTLRRADGIRFRDALTRRAIKAVNTAASADNVLTTIKALTNVAKDQEWLTINPFERLTVTEGGRESEGREPWTVEELSRLFDAPLFTQYVLPAGNAIANKAGADAAYWVPLLLLYTGARPSEVCQLWTDDLSVVDGHMVMEIREDPARGTSLKNRSSRRALPIHSELLRLGFSDYWQSVVARSNGAGLALPRRAEERSQWGGGPVRPVVRRVQDLAGIRHADEDAAQLQAHGRDRAQLRGGVADDDRCHHWPRGAGHRTEGLRGNDQASGDTAAAAS